MNYTENLSTSVLWTIGVLYGILSLVTIGYFWLDHKKKSAQSKELITRTQSWWFLMVVVGLIVLSPALIGTIVLAYLAFMGSRELYSIGNLKFTDRAAILVAYLLIPIQFYLAYTFQYHWFLNFIPMVGLTLIPIVLILSGYSGNIGRSITFIPGVLMLTAYSFSHMVLIYGLDIEGYAIGAGGILLFLILITELNDIFQYNWGKAFGKHVILPRISPNKTWEGFLGGVFTTTLVAGIFHFLTPLSFIQSMIAGLLLSVFGFFGDALLSAIKRDLKVKDTDDLIPGHGGVMDRMDSLVFNAPVFFYLITLFTNQNL